MVIKQLFFCKFSRTVKIKEFESSSKILPILLLDSLSGNVRKHRTLETIFVLEPFNFSQSVESSHMSGELILLG